MSQIGSKKSSSVNANDRSMVLLAQDTGEPRPDWMTDREKLPKKPPPHSLGPARGSRREP